MWVFDGEEWTQEGVSEEKRKPESMTVPYDAFPELQVVEIVQTPKRPVPPFPMP
jgi:hypothetical protein